MENSMRDKSFSFAINVVLLGQQMAKSKEFILSKQLVRSGTGIGALIREAQYAESLLDYKHKFALALKEANETKYWLDIINETYPLYNEKSTNLKQLCGELVAMLIATINTLKEKLSKIQTSKPKS